MTVPAVLGVSTPDELMLAVPVPPLTMDHETVLPFPPPLPVFVVICSVLPIATVGDAFVIANSVAGGVQLGEILIVVK